MAGGNREIDIGYKENRKEQRTMSGRKKTAVKNGMIGFIGQLASLCLQIVSRSVFIRYIGEEMLGLNNTFTSFLYTFSLAELGFQSAIAFNLFKPLREKNEQEIIEIVNVYKIIYRVVGIFFVAASVLSLPLLPLITKNVTITNEIRVYYLIQALASSCTYFLAYKRTILYADQKDYICKLVDMFTNVVFRALQIWAIVALHSYFVYIVLQLVQVYANNIIIHCMCSRYYPYLHKVKFNKTYAKKMFEDAKQIFAGRLAVYVYSATDNLIVSKVIGTVQVAFLGNYTTITANMKMLINGLLYPITPIIGNYLAGDEDADHQKRNLGIYTHLRFIVTLLLLIPTLVLVDDFILMWVGSKYILQPVIKVLLVADLYFFLIQGACSDYITGRGLFKQDKYVTIIGALMNVVLSLAFVGKWGMAGILVGTVISQVFNWLGHGFVVYKYCFASDWKGFAGYIEINIYYMICFAGMTMLSAWLYAKVNIASMPMKFVAGGVLCEAVVLLGYVALCFWCSETKTLGRMLAAMVKGRLKRK